MSADTSRTPSTFIRIARILSAVSGHWQAGTVNSTNLCPATAA